MTMSVSDLREKLSAVCTERDALQLALKKFLNQETDSSDNILGIDNNLHMIELTSVIAELKKQLQSQKEQVILEEVEEVEESVQSYCSSINRDSDEDPIEANNGNEMVYITTSNDANAMPDSNHHKEKRETNSGGKADLESLHFELLKIRRDHTEIKESLFRKDEELRNTQAAMRNLSRQRDLLQNKVSELEETLKGSIFRCSCTTNKKGKKSLPTDIYSHIPKDHSVELKLASRIRLPTNTIHDDSKNNLTGNSLTKAIGESDSVVEMLCQDIREDSKRRELQLSYGQMDDTMAEIQLENERLQSKILNLRSDNDVLRICLEEAKNRSQSLMLQIGQYESNQIAIGIVTSICDSCFEAYDILVALLESELGQLLANCRAAGIGNYSSSDNMDVMHLLQKANENRNTAESAAKSFLNNSGRDSIHYQSYSRSQSQSSSSMSMSQDLDYPSSCSASPQPQHHHQPHHSQQTQLQPHTKQKSVEQQIRETIIKLKTEKVLTTNTILPLNSSWSLQDIQPSQTMLSPKRKDLETAVLMQELMSLREERSDYRSGMYILQKQNHSLELSLKSLKSQEDSYQNRIKYLQSCLDNNGNELMLNVDKNFAEIEKGFRLREHQLQEIIQDLNSCNHQLVFSLQDMKKKYESRVKKLENELVKLFVKSKVSIKD